MIGGFCVGTRDFTIPQILSGTGYCFSASMPPYLAVAATAAVDLLDRDVGSLRHLQTNIGYMRSALNSVEGIAVTGDNNSPLMHIRLEKSFGSRDSDEDLLRDVVNKVCFVFLIMLL